ncbi:MAG: alkaline phosphatase family protein [Planctomycetes bacterium]|nr:alkaline phosphatase family protein [Planctomycetota bacterium]
MRIIGIGILILALAAGGCGVPGPDGPADSFGLDLSMPPDAHKGGAIVFLVDAMDADAFERMLNAGELPSFKKYFVDRGLYVSHAVGNLPSNTLVNLVSVATGQLPGHHGIIGNTFFDREKRLYRDYTTIAQKNLLDAEYAARTIYEMAGGLPSYSIFYQPHRGATKFFENWTSAGPPFFFGWYEFVDRIALFRLGEMMALARQAGKFPAVTMVYLLAPDFYAYRRGASSAEYREAIRHADRQIGRVLGDLQRAGLLEKTVIALVSDHGTRDVQRHFSIDNFLANKCGLAVETARLAESDADADENWRRKFYGYAQAVTFGGGDKYCAICLRKPAWLGKEHLSGLENWPVRPMADDLKNYPSGKILADSDKIDRVESDGKWLDLPAILVAQDAVDMVCWRMDENVVRVLRKGGMIEFTQSAGRAGAISCRMVSGNDPLGWAGKAPDELLKGKAASPDEWLKATLDSEYPDLPAQILAYFRADRRGDIVVFASEGWDFGKSNKAGHGTPRRCDMLVPLLIAGPGVPREAAGPVRTVDLAPTIMGLLGLPVPKDIDGKNIFQKPP